MHPEISIQPMQWAARTVLSDAPNARLVDDCSMQGAAVKRPNQKQI